MYPNQESAEESAQYLSSQVDEDQLRFKNRALDPKGHCDSGIEVTAAETKQKHVIKNIKKIKKKF